MRSHTLRVLILVALAVASFQVVFQPVRLDGWRPAWQPPQPRLRLGLDLQGGTRIVLEAERRPGVEVTADKVDAAMRVIENRIDALGVAEPLLQRQGQDRIIVEFPGLQDPQRAKELIGRTALLEFVDTDHQSLPRGAEWLPDNRRVRLPDGQVVSLPKKVVVTGADLRDARAEFDQQSLQWLVRFRFAGEGARKFEDHTGRSIGEYLTIVLDNRVLSSPVIRARIPGEGVIEGSFTADEARDLAILLRGGALPVPVRPVEERTVGPTLGRDSIDRSLRAGWIAAVAVVLFVTAYYRLPGFLASVSLSVYALLVLALFAGLGATLTLPGLAGLILSLGIAVDGNVIIFEKLKEELRAGKTLRAAIAAGWRRGLVTILDSNVTTLVGAAVLLWLGTGPIRGFAVTLTLGVLASMFTAIVATRWLVELCADLGLAHNLARVADLPRRPEVAA
ncbi:MAG: protein translocase subunit SecD [Armatimonadota bacterium]|nr:protein translocase subunit SecD [Armatimonadota bacterium]MDR5676518.1 protein translocase subunit SecD [Armatimonadota bacterium]MDR5689794.1 protein translocase subunit SecD [Armatimonadota bacterium]MDR7387581.1 protein translocase subunit SecD [Armatimonadota bacterium]MDR7389070.1 protein translocase subunit SecD [Armatimonadota bacterium]